MKPSISRSVAIVSSLLTAVSAQVLTNNYNPTGAGCVDPSGFTKCYSTVANNAVQCTQFCKTDTPSMTGVTYQDCILGCEGLWLASNIGCWIQSCWNQVYSCEYQMTAMSYFDGTDLVQNSNIPFYPAPQGPEGGPGACSCNLGYVYGNITAISQNLICTTVAGSGDLNAVYTCECCEFSWGVSNSLSACPKSDLSIVGFPAYLASMQKLLASSTDKCAILDNGSSQCISQYQYPFVAGAVYNPLNLPSGEPGTEALSNTAGNAFTEFGASTFVLSLFPGYTSTITPAAFNAKAGAATGTVMTTGVPAATGGAGVVSTGSVASSVTGTGSGSSAVATTTGTQAKSGGSKVEKSLVLVGGIFVAYIGVWLL